jgi:DedD protein
MGLFSFLNKNKQDTSADEPAYQSRAEEESRAMRGRGAKEGKDGKEGKGRGRANSTAADPVLPEKKRARRRLVGAVALVVAIVIGLPMVLDSEPKPLVDDIAIQIPSKDKVAAAQPVAPVAPVESAHVPPVSASLDQKEEVVDTRTIVPVDAGAKVAASALKPASDVQADTKPAAAPAAAPSKPLVAAAVTAATVATVAAVKAAPSAAAPASAASKPAASPPAKVTAPAVDEVARANAILDGKPEPKAAAKAPDVKGEKVVLQVAALATQEKINEVLTRLKGAGFAPYTQKIATATGDRTQIRVAVNKDEVDKMRARLVKLGFDRTFVAK